MISNVTEGSFREGPGVPTLYVVNGVEETYIAQADLRPSGIYVNRSFLFMA